MAQMSTLLPNEIPPIGTWTLSKTGALNENCWLFLYNLAQHVLGTQGSTSSVTAIQVLTDVDSDAQTTDFLSFDARITALEQQLAIPQDPVPSLTQSVPEDLPPANHRAQPVWSVIVGASPFVYTAQYNGILLITGGTVSAISLNRGAGFLSTGLTVGVIPVRQRDQVQITWSGVPTVTFYPN
jgi:hypothetical protein